MKQPQIGDVFVIDTIVTQAMLAQSVGSGGLKVLSTPSLLTLFEKAAYLMAEEYMEEGFTTVGTEMKLSHLAPSPCDAKIKLQIRLTMIEGRTFGFEMKASDVRDTIAVGAHQRVCVDKVKFQNKADKKFAAE